MNVGGRRRFSLAAVLYVTNSGNIPVGSSQTLAEVQDLLTFMTGSPHRVAIGQIPRAADVCRKYLLDQHSWLSDMAATPGQIADSRKLMLWLRGCEKQRGDTVVVTAAPGDAYQACDPIKEWLMTQGVSERAGA